MTVVDVRAIPLRLKGMPAATRYPYAAVDAAIAGIAQVADHECARLLKGTQDKLLEHEWIDFAQIGKQSRLGRYSSYRPKLRQHAASLAHASLVFGQTA
ncbi:hypothetical protein RugamoR57_48760 [Duganella caerulea]